VTYLWSFDPGLDTGAALGEYDNNVPYKIHATWSIPDGLDGFIQWSESQQWLDTDEAVTERFVIDGTITGVWAPQIEGALAFLQHMYGFSITWQLRTDKTTLKAGSERVRNAWLKTKVAHKMTTQHERDAVTHALVYLKRKRHLPTLKEYWGDNV
jgi:hypothetical protein